MNDMIRRIDHNKMGGSDLGWLQSKFHFSFADYYNPDNIKFGKLRVINDDLVAPHTGFDRHPHKDMEIISYVVDGELSHKDSMGNASVLRRGEVQYMSAGTGVYHSEYNHGEETLRLLQIWIIPDARDHEPNYGEYRFAWSSREGNWLHMVSPMAGSAKVKINQDVNFHVISLDEGKEAAFEIASGRQAYLVQIEGESSVNGIDLLTRDGMEVVEENIMIKAKSKAHILLIEMKVGGNTVKRSLYE